MDTNDSKPRIEDTKKGSDMLPCESVGMIRLERTTPTSRTWCASQLRYIPKNKVANLRPCRLYASLLM